MAKATDQQIIEFVKNEWAEFGLSKISVSQIETREANKYGTVRHFVHAVCTWTTQPQTANCFEVTEDLDGTLR